MEKKMSTLEEVIAKCTDCRENWAHWSENVDFIEKQTLIDVIQYLTIFKQNRDQLHGLIEDYRREIKGENPPLTYSELEQMIGCPVWVEADHAFIQYSGWTLIEQEDDSCNVHGMIFTCPDRSKFFLLREFIGNTWNAYRKPYRKPYRQPKPDPEEYPVHCGCGGEPEIIKHPNGKYTVSCTRGGCMANVGWCPDEKTAITAWNRAMGAKR